MINITVLQDSAGHCRGYSAEGHAGYADSGYDIICAAVSVLAQNTANAIERFTSDTIEGEADEEKGSLRVSFPDGVSGESELLLKAMISGMEDIADRYGSRFIRIRYEEV